MDGRSTVVSEIIPQLAVHLFCYVLHRRSRRGYSSTYHAAFQSRAREQLFPIHGLQLLTAAHTLFRYLTLTLSLTLYLRTCTYYDREFAIYQILLGWKHEHYYETVELHNPRPTQPKKK